MNDMVTGIVEGDLTYKDARRLADCFKQAVEVVNNSNSACMDYCEAIVNYDVPFTSEKGSNPLTDINKKNYWNGIPYVVKAVGRRNNRDDWGQHFIDLKSGPKRSSPEKVFQMEPAVLEELQAIIARRYQRGNDVWTNQPCFVPNS